LKAGDLEAVAVYEKPHSRLFRVLRSQASAAPSDVGFVLRHAPEFLGDALLIRRRYRNDLSDVNRGFRRHDVPTLFADHQLAHASAAFLASPYEDAAVLVLDSPGGWTASSWWSGKGNHLVRLSEQRHPDSPYLLHAGMAAYLGFPVLGGAYRIMGLAGFGDDTSPFYKTYRDAIRQELVDLSDDGTLRLNPHYFRSTRAERLLREKAWIKLFGLRQRRPDEAIKRRHANLALAMQRVMEEILFRQARELQRQTGSRNLCLGGELALNATANARLQREGIFDAVYVPPAPGNAGTALGAALAVRHLRQGHRRETDGERDFWRHGLLGPVCEPAASDALVDRFGAVLEVLPPRELVDRVAQDLADGKVVAWCQDRMAFGPMSLGTRNILADPRVPGMQRRINVKIKYRSSFRPLSAVVLEEDAADLFEHGTPSPYLAFTDRLAERHRMALPWDYNTFTVKQKHHQQRAEWQAAVHVDFTVRAQTLRPAQHPRFYRLLQAFKELTGCPMLVSTGFNLKSKPLVSSPEDAYRTFMQCDLDVLVIGEHYFEKNRQPEWEPQTLYTG
jgi:carbamoyltransferase